MELGLPPEGSHGWGLVCPLGWLWAGAAFACGMARGRPLGWIAQKRLDDSGGLGQGVDPRT